MTLAPIGLWMFQLDTMPWSQGRDLAQEIEALGYGAIWYPEAVGRDPLVAGTLLLDATDHIVAATGIASIYGRGPVAMNAGWQTLSAAHERFLLGLGVSHQPAVEGFHKREYGPPLTAMREYLDAMDTAPFFATRCETPPRRVLAALGPKMLALAAERADGAHPYNVTPEHTKLARDILGPRSSCASSRRSRSRPTSTRPAPPPGRRSRSTRACRTM